MTSRTRPGSADFTLPGSSASAPARARWGTSAGCESSAPRAFFRAARLRLPRWPPPLAFRTRATSHGHSDGSSACRRAALPEAMTGAPGLRWRKEGGRFFWDDAPLRASQGRSVGASSLTAIDGIFHSMITADLLTQISLFAPLPESERASLAARAADVRIGADEYLLIEGQTPAFFGLLEGRIDVSKVVGGREQRLTTYGPGDYFGEVPLLLGAPALASLQATEPARLMRLDAPDFLEMVTQCRVLSGEISRTMATRVARLQQVTVETRLRPWPRSSGIPPTRSVTACANSCLGTGCLSPGARMATYRRGGGATAHSGPGGWTATRGAFVPRARRGPGHADRPDARAVRRGHRGRRARRAGSRRCTARRRGSGHCWWSAPRWAGRPAPLRGSRTISAFPAG